MEKDRMQKLVHISTITPIALIAVGALKLIVYYKFFNISIGQFLRIQDILTLVFDDIFYYLIFGIGLYILFVFIYSDSMGKYNKEVFNNIYQTESFLSRIKRQPFSFFFSTVMFTLIIILSFFIKKLAEVRIDFLFYTFYFSIIPVLQIEFERKFISIHTDKNLTLLHNFLMYATMFLYIFFVHTREEVKAVKRFKYYGTEIFINNSIYKSDSTSNYIGKTMDYYFFHNIKDNSTTVFPADQVNKIIIKQKKR